MVEKGMVERVLKATFTEKGVVLDKENNATLEDVVVLTRILQQETSFESIISKRLADAESRLGMLESP